MAGSVAPDFFGADSVRTGIKDRGGRGWPPFYKKFTCGDVNVAIAWFGICWTLFWMLYIC